MFGYVRPLKGEMKVRHFEQYQAAYCGLCRCLGKAFGFAARFTVNYDLTFLYCLLKAEVPALEHCRCPACPWKKKACAPMDEAMYYTAQVNVLLTWWRLQDTAWDEHGVRAAGARLGAMVLKRAYRRAAAGQPELDQLIRVQLEKLRVLERAQSPSVDATADAFAQILAACACFWPDGPQRRTGAQLLYHVGRYLYLADALEDLPKDCEKGRYNPLRYRFHVEQGALSQVDREYFMESVELSIGQAAVALSLLPKVSPVVENVIGYGMPAVLQSIAAGTFHNKKDRIRSAI